MSSCDSSFAADRLAVALEQHISHHRDISAAPPTFGARWDFGSPAPPPGIGARRVPPFAVPALRSLRTLLPDT